jgi:hypothetical protein
MATLDLKVPSATHLVYAARTDADTHADWVAGADNGTCLFCGHTGPTVPAANTINQQYFNDDDIASAPYSDRVCVACAYCMDTQKVKQGHWIATTDRFKRVSTGDLPDTFGAIRRGEYDPPIAVKIAEAPIRSSHGYLWTPVSYSVAPLRICYDRSMETPLVKWDLLDQLVDDIEELRWHGFRLEDIREDAPRVDDLESVGYEVYDRIRERTIEPHGGTALFEVAITLSRAADDQDRDETTDGNTTLSKYT